MQILPNGDVYVSDGPRPKRDARPAREQIIDLITGYDCENDNPNEVADRIIRLAKRA